MQINEPAQSYTPNFNGITRIRLKNGNTAVLNVKGDRNNMTVTKIFGDIMSKGKSVGKINYQKKDGYSTEEFACIAEEIGKDAKNPKNVIFKLFDALMSKD